MKLTARFNVGLYATLSMVKNQYKKLMADPSEETIHDLRVSIRRLRPFIQALEQSLSKNQSACRQVELYSEYLKNIFKSLSTIRDRQVHLLRLEVLGQNHDLHSENIERIISEEVMMLSAVLMNQASNWDLEATSDKIMVMALSHPVQKAEIKAYIQKTVASRQKKALSCLAHNLCSDREIHSFRIALKKFRYALEMSEKLQIDQDLKASSIKSGQDLLGYFQDLSVLQAHISELQAESTLISVIENELNSTRATVIDSLPTWLMLLRNK